MPENATAIAMLRRIRILASIQESRSNARECHCNSNAAPHAYLGQQQVEEECLAGATWCIEKHNYINDNNRSLLPSE